MYLDSLYYQTIESKHFIEFIWLYNFIFYIFYARKIFIIYLLNMQKFLESGIHVLGVWDDHDYGMNNGGKVI